MTAAEKACPVVFRMRDRRPEILAFRHPLAGKQFVKGTVEKGEVPVVAAARELREESGLALPSPLKSIGAHTIGGDGQLWHFFSCSSAGLPETWQHRTDDDCGHTFIFFWHPLHKMPDHRWQPIFHEAFGFFASRIGNE